jgi:NAD(P)-dependent dehydrogenase (short-subunit alcohol dehydrogenase family)
MDGRKPLQGEVALVTGGAKRIGAAISRAVSAAGAAVVVHHHESKREAIAMVEELRAAGGQAWTVRGDLGKAGNRQKLMHDSRKAAGAPITLLVNNASSFPENKVSNLSREDLREAVEVNAWAPFALARTFAEELPAGRRGAIVNLIDARVHDYDWSHVGYWLAKRMLADLTRLCAVEFAPGVRVNGVSPGAVLGPSNRPMTPEEEKEFLTRMAKHIPLRRTPTPQDIADAVVFLLSARATTGTVIEVDGGRHLGRAVYG